VICWLQAQERSRAPQSARFRQLNPFAQQTATPAPSASVAPSHYHPKGKPPSSYTIAAQNVLRKSMPFADKLDFEEAKRGFIAAPPFKQIMAEGGGVAWDIGRYDFLLQGRDFDSIHPSLQRIAILNMAYGLYEVVLGAIYQVRGFDLANISFVKSQRTAWRAARGRRHLLARSRRSFRWRPRRG
jgi:alkyl sulfatase BDS1-like metallo-beta-lactamase superfamily hydrolase